MTMMHKRLILALLGIVTTTAVLAACGPSAEELAETTAAAATDTPVPTATPEPNSSPEPTATPVPDPARGQLLYELGPEGVYEPFCANCHMLTDRDFLGPGFEGIADRAATRVPGLSAEEYIRQSIVDPEAHIAEGDWPEDEVMPTTYAEAYSEQDINDLVAFLMTQ
jgi:mono/diheme cytochrome c family protein